MSRRVSPGIKGGLKIGLPSQKCLGCTLGLKSKGLSRGWPSGKKLIRISLNLSSPKRALIWLSVIARRVLESSSEILVSAIISLASLTNVSNSKSWEGRSKGHRTGAERVWDTG